MSTTDTNKPIQSATRQYHHLIYGTSKATRGASLNNMGFFHIDSPEEKRARLLNALKRTSLFEKLWYSIFLLAILLCLVFIRPITFQLCFSVINVIMYMTACNLVAQGKVLGFLFEIFASLTFIVVCIFNRVYGEIIMNILVYIPLNIVSIINFRKNTNKETKQVNVRQLTLKQWLVIIAIFATLTAGIFSILRFALNQVSPFLNAVLISISIISMVIMSQRFKEFWYFDLAGNFISTLMWLFISTKAPNAIQSLPIVISSFAAFTNNIYGIWMWNKIYKRNNSEQKSKPINHEKVIKVRRKINKLNKTTREG